MRGKGSGLIRNAIKSFALHMLEIAAFVPRLRDHAAMIRHVPICLSALCPKPRPTSSSFTDFTLPRSVHTPHELCTSGRLSGQGLITSRKGEFVVIFNEEGNVTDIFESRKWIGQVVPG
ncbi:hypothetical protein AAC387_Pa06g1777 [Persea americana]